MLEILLTLLMAVNVAFGGTVGNIDLDNRIVVANPDGGYSTELSFSTEFDGVEVLLPTVINGLIVSEEEAVEHFLATGEHLGKFCCWQFAEVYAEMLHLRQEEFYRKEVKQCPSTISQIQSWRKSTSS